jgi:hypothetical protein
MLRTLFTLAVTVPAAAPAALRGGAQDPSPHRSSDAAPPSSSHARSHRRWQDAVDHRRRRLGAFNLDFAHDSRFSGGGGANYSAGLVDPTQSFGQWEVRDNMMVAMIWCVREMMFFGSHAARCALNAPFELRPL